MTNIICTVVDDNGHICDGKLRETIGNSKKTKFDVIFPKKKKRIVSLQRMNKRHETHST